MNNSLKHIISIDQGTTSSRAIAFDLEGKPVYTAQKEFTQIFPKQGWIEHNPEEIFKTQLEVLEETIKHVGSDSVLGLAITNQRETVVLWDKNTGKPFYNAIVWQDTRTMEYCNTLKKNKGSYIHEKTGLIVDTYFSASKINWVLDEVDEARLAMQENRLCIGTIDTWLVYNLSDGLRFYTDHSNASRTMLYNLHTQNWDQELLDLFDINKEALPEIKNSADDYGVYTSSGNSIPIVSVIGDQQAALFGQGCIKAGKVKNTYGTGCFMLMNTGDKPKLANNGLLTTVAYAVNDSVTYALEGSVFIGGAVVQWLRDGINIISEASETAEMAKNASDNELFFVPAFSGLGTPHWDMTAAGMIIGLTRDTSREDVVKASLESIAFQSKELLDAMISSADTVIDIVHVDGGAVSNEYLMQFQADIAQCSIRIPICKESTALGAALMGGVKLGIWTLEEAATLNKEDSIFKPNFSSDATLKKLSRWKLAVEKSKNWHV